MSNTYIVYHKDCADGFAAFWLMKQSLPLAIGIPQAYPVTDPHVYGDDTVYFVDICPKIPVLLDVCKAVKHVVLLDHHQTARDDLLALSAAPPANLSVVFDIEKCGASLVLSIMRQESLSCGALVFGDEIVLHSTSLSVDIDDWIAYIQDRDLWTWTRPDSRAISSVIALNDYTIPDYTSLFNRHVGEGVKAEGYAILGYQRHLVAALIKKATVRSIPGPNGARYEVPCLNTSCLTSECGEALADASDAPFVALWHERPGFRTWSLRVSKHKSFDASIVAKFHGGGGHAKACGWEETIAP